MRLLERKWSSVSRRPASFRLVRCAPSPSHSALRRAIAATSGANLVQRFLQHGCSHAQDNQSNRLSRGRLPGGCASVAGCGSTRSEITHFFTQDVDPPEDEAVTWTEEQLRDYFSSGGEIRPERRDTSVAGGFRDLPPPPPTCFPENMPKIGDCLLYTSPSPRD